MQGDPRRGEVWLLRMCPHLQCQRAKRCRWTGPRGKCLGSEPTKRDMLTRLLRLTESAIERIS